MADVANPNTPISNATPVSTIQIPSENTTPISFESIIPPSANVSSSVADSSTEGITTPSMLPMLKNQSIRSQFTFSLETPSLSSGTLDKYLKNVLGHDSMNALPELLKHPNSENILTPQTSSSLVEKPPQDVSREIGIEHSKSKEPESDEESAGSSPSNQLATTSDGKAGEVIPIPRGQQYVDITDYLNMPQADAAKKLGIPPSTLSKRWKEVRKRKWPYRMICKIDKEIMTLLHNVPQGSNAPPLPEEIEVALGKLLRRRQEELRPVVIRI